MSSLTKFDVITDSNLTNDTMLTVFRYADYITFGLFAPGFLYTVMFLVYLVLVRSNYSQFAIVSSTVVGVFVAFMMSAAGVLHPIHLFITFFLAVGGIYISSKNKGL